eukprot:SAG31_NODE_125_length_23649_cov_7.156202_7_plen_139_part_00
MASSAAGAVDAMAPLQRSDATFVLVGGEAAEWHGGPWHTREFEHTSLGFVGEAYASLREAGIPRANIIVIAQLADYFDALAHGVRGALTAATGIPPQYYADQKARTEARCARLLEEGGAHFDHKTVNPGTVWSVLVGE